MGTHPSLPSKDLATGRSLLDLVGDNQALMGSEHHREVQQEITVSLQSPVHQQGPLNPSSSQQEAGWRAARQRPQELPR